MFFTILPPSPSYDREDTYGKCDDLQVRPLVRQVPTSLRVLHGVAFIRL